jgi:hypothetical protein
VAADEEKVFAGLVREVEPSLQVGPLAFRFAACGFRDQARGIQDPADLRSGAVLDLVFDAVP